VQTPTLKIYFMDDKNRKEGRYSRIADQLDELLKKPGNTLSKMATIAAVLHHKMDDFFWTGFYLLEISDLIAGPYQGPVACQLLARNQGVCWSAVNKKETVIVPNVHDFPGHIACDGRSNSEIVIPVFDDQQQVKAVLDIDSTKLNSFDETDKKGLEKIVAMIYR